MRFLTDEDVAVPAACDIAEAALDAIDPALRLRVPREVARRFLLGYRGGVSLFVSEHYPRSNVRRRAERRAMIESNRAIDVSLLEETLDAHGWGMGDTYSEWRWPKVLYFFEGFLGAEVVARALVAHLERAAHDFKRWGDAGKDPDRGSKLVTFLAERGIEARRLWRPLHLLSIYREAQADHPEVAERLYEGAVNLPSSVHLSLNQQDRVVRTVVEFARGAA